MAVMRPDGSVDNRGCCYLFACFAMECFVYIYCCQYCWISYYRVRYLVCNDDLVFLLMLQAILSSCAFVFGAPVAEIVSAEPSYFEGLRILFKSRWYKVIILHIALECTVLVLSVLLVVRIDLLTCDVRLVDTIWWMIYVQAPLLLFRGGMHVLLPVVRSMSDRQFMKQYGDVLSKKDPLKRDGDGGVNDEAQSMPPEELERRKRELAVLRAKADIDVNFHEYERAWSERRPLEKGRLTKVENSLGRVGRAYLEKEKELLPALSAKKEKERKKDKGAATEKAFGLARPEGVAAIEGVDGAGGDRALVAAKGGKKSSKVAPLPPVQPKRPPAVSSVLGSISARAGDS